MIESSFQP